MYQGDQEAMSTASDLGIVQVFPARWTAEESKRKNHYCPHCGSYDVQKITVKLEVVEYFQVVEEADCHAPDVERRMVEDRGRIGTPFYRCEDCRTLVLESHVNRSAPCSDDCKCEWVLDRELATIFANQSDRDDAEVEEWLGRLVRHPLGVGPLVKFKPNVKHNARRFDDGFVAAVKLTVAGEVLYAVSSEGEGCGYAEWGLLCREDGTHFQPTDAMRTSLKDKERFP
jgi:hypothetical protein